MYTKKHMALMTFVTVSVMLNLFAYAPEFVEIKRYDLYKTEIKADDFQPEQNFLKSIDKAVGLPASKGKR